MTRSRRRLTLEQLEDRLTPSSITNIPWPDPQHLTLSFAPDTTSTAQAGSVLFQTLNAVAPTHAWELEILRAFQTWAALGNVNIAVVNDGGQPFGTPGLPQGDPRFGDIRVGMIPMADTNLATSNPFTWAGSTWAGDALLNSNINFGIQGQGQYDLFSVMLHEAGHDFGLGDTYTDPTSVMYYAYEGVRSTPNAQDIANFLSQYGPRMPDQYQGTTGDGSFSTAYNFGALSLNGLNLNADLGSPTQSEYYKFTAPLLTTGLTINLTTANISSLVGTVSVYDANHNLLGTASASDPMNGNLSLSVRANPGGTYYVEVNGATGDVFSVGSYNLTVGVKTVLSAIQPVVSGLVNVANNVTSSLGLPILLAPKWSSPSYLGFNATYRGNVNAVNNTYYFQVQSPPAQLYGSGPFVMTTMVWGTDSPVALDPYAEVWTAGPNPQLLASQVLTDSQGVYTIQFAAAQPGTAYDVIVRALTPNGSNNTGNFFLGINFHSEPAVQFTDLAQGAATASGQSQFSALTLNQDELLQFSLTSSDGGASAAEEVQMQIYDQNGNLVCTLVSHPGQPPVTAAVYLLAGTYTVRFTAVAQNPSLFVPLTFDFQDDLLSDPLGPQKTSTTDSPSGSTGSPPTATATPPSSTSAGSAATYSQPVYA